MKAILLGTDRGARLHPLTADRPACMVEVRGIPMLHWQLHALRAAGITDCTVVRGWCRTAIRGAGVCTVDNPRWDRTAGAADLWCAFDELRGDLIVARADLVCRPSVVQAARDSGADVAILVDHAARSRYPSMSSWPEDDIAMLRLSPHGTDLLRDVLRRAFAAHRRGTSLFERALPFDSARVTDLVGVLAREGVPVKKIVTDGGWTSIENVDALRAAEQRITRERWSLPSSPARRATPASGAAAAWNPPWSNP